MKSKKTILSIAAFLTVYTAAINAQEHPQDTVQKTLENLQSDIKSMKKLKITGYMQAQAQLADSMGIASFAGGNFNANTDKRFSVRRGRVKFTYDNKMSQYVLQLDATQGGVAIKDAYVRFTAPFAKALHTTIGVFDRPFGYEIGYSSSSRESPERGRMSQIIFPGERDLGAMLTFQMPKASKWNMLKIDAGMFNGTGPTANDFDYQKDFIGRIRIDRTSNNEKLIYGIGVSMYSGGWRQGTSKVYYMTADSAGMNAFQMHKDTALNGVISGRSYGGADLQLSYDFPFGLTTLRAEYIEGVQPGTSSALTSLSAQPTSDNYKRNFNGAYFYFLQNIGQSKHQLVVKYDWFDPNTDVAGDEIGASVLAFKGETFAKTGKADLKYSTLGLGWTYRWDANVKIVAYYDMVTNEVSKNVAKVTKDLSDNVFTLRIQYKF